MTAVVLREEGSDDTAVADGPEPTIRTHNPMGIDVATIDSYRGQQNKLVLFTTVSATSGPKFVANANRLCVALTRMEQAMIVVGDLGNRARKSMEITENG